MGLVLDFCFITTRFIIVAILLGATEQECAQILDHRAAAVSGDKALLSGWSMLCIAAPTGQSEPPT